MSKELPPEIKQKHCVSQDWQIPYAEAIELIKNGAQLLHDTLKEKKVFLRKLESVQDLLNDLEEFEDDFFEVVECLADGEEIDDDEISEQIDNSGFIEGINDDVYEHVLDVFYVNVDGEDIDPEQLKPAFKILHEGFARLLSAHRLA